MFGRGRRAVGKIREPTTDACETVSLAVAAGAFTSSTLASLTHTSLALALALSAE
jgi:hypothetical protein